MRLPDGREIDDFYTVQLPEYTVIVAVTPNQLIVVEQHYRPGLDEVTLTLPSGFLEPGEDALEGAQRELREETGYEASRWSRLGSFIVDGNRGCGRAHLFLAREAAQVAAPDGQDLAEVAIQLRRPEDLLAAARSGEARELASAAALGLAVLELHG